MKQTNAKYDKKKQNFFWDKLNKFKLNPMC